MSGICGILRFDGTAVAERDLDRQMKALAHRGPDRAQLWAGGPAGLGHLLMRITHEDRFDAQPLHDGNVSLVADLRLDNRGDLAQALSIDAAVLTDMPDSALLLRAYRTWGANCVDHLLGDFAFAVWDGTQKTLTLGRDHMGQRHVFYTQGDGFFAFATEIKGLWALPQVPRILLEDTMVRRFLYEQPEDIAATGYGGIRAIPGGTVLTVSANGAVTVRRYWEPQADPPRAPRRNLLHRDLSPGRCGSRPMPIASRHQFGRVVHGRRLRLERHLCTGRSGRERTEAQVHRGVLCYA
jgi:asparagine synthase (glutamine-hydrolysing)